MAANYAGLGPADFEEAVGQKLAPPGLAWPREPTTIFQRFWRVIADALVAVHARTGVLTEREAFPPISVELLPDWERVLGLPDPCLGPNPSTPARQAAVAARLSSAGGQSVPYFEALAVLLGGSITVTEYVPFRLGVDHFGDPLRVAAWAYIWTVTLSTGSLFRFELGVSHFGEPLWQISSGPIQCEIQRLKPAHTQVNFALAPGVVGGWGDFIADVSLSA